MMSTQRWEFFTVGQFQFGKISKWMNLNLVENQFGSFTMGVNLKKVNINLEFVTERIAAALRESSVLSVVVAGGKMILYFTTHSMSQESTLMRK